MSRLDRQGLENKQIEFVSIPKMPRDFEDPFQRLHRLKSEVELFREDLEELAKTV